MASIIQSLQSNKAPGEDYLPPELFKSHIGWWAPLLAGLFSYIDYTGSIPVGWEVAIVIPLHKKGDKSDPGNYRPISLISIVAKMYAKHLLNKLLDWTSDSNILAEEQAGFRPGRATIDNCFVLHHLVARQISKGKQLYTAFINLNTAFDSLNRELLWKKLARLNMEPRLLALIKALYANTQLKVRVGLNGSLSKAIPTHKGVRQGCILAPMLFNLYINDLPGYLCDTSLHMLKIHDKFTNILLYADDMALMAHSQIGLRRSLRKLHQYCVNNSLVINKSKSKVLVFSKRNKIYNWFINGEPIEQVTSFTYLGITFNHTGTWSNHFKRTALKAEQSVNQILKLISYNCPSSLTPILKVFRAKIVPMLNYGAEIWGLSKAPLLESVQTSFLRKILGTDKNTVAYAVRAETGIFSISSYTVCRAFSFWLKVQSMGPDRLPKLCLIEQANHVIPNSWARQIGIIIAHFGFSTQSILDCGQQAKIIFKQRALDLSAQQDMELLSKNRALSWLSENKLVFV